jgi:uncharacterized protein YlxP (DUF503 family)
VVTPIRVAACSLELYIPSASSLKTKRQILKSLIQRLRNEFNLSVTEVGQQDLWQKAELGLAVVCHNSNGADRILQKIFDFIESDYRVEIIDRRVEIY